jgi:hypothetical protein
MPGRREPPFSVVAYSWATLGAVHVTGVWPTTTSIFPDHVAGCGIVRAHR